MGKEYEGVIRSHFVIDEEGRIADAQVNVQAKTSVKRALGVTRRMPASEVQFNEET